MFCFIFLCCTFVLLVFFACFLCIIFIPHIHHTLTHTPVHSVVALKQEVRLPGANTQEEDEDEEDDGVV